MGSFSRSAHLGGPLGAPGYNFLSLGQGDSWDCDFPSYGQGKCVEGLEECALPGACRVGLLASLQTACGVREN